MKLVFFIIAVSNAFRIWTVNSNLDTFDGDQQDYYEVPQLNSFSTLVDDFWNNISNRFWTGCEFSFFNPCEDQEYIDYYDTTDSPVETVDPPTPLSNYEILGQQILAILKAYDSELADLICKTTGFCYISNEEQTIERPDCENKVELQLGVFICQDDDDLEDLNENDYEDEFESDEPDSTLAPVEETTIDYTLAVPTSVVTEPVIAQPEIDVEITETSDH